MQFIWSFPKKVVPLPKLMCGYMFNCSGFGRTFFRIVHKWVVPSIHLVCWLTTYLCLEEYIQDKAITYGSELWFPLLEVVPVCSMFFIGFIVSLFDLFCANTDANTSISILLPMLLVFTLVTIVSILFFVFLPASEDAKHKILVAIFFVSAGAKFMESWIQNNIARFMVPHRALDKVNSYERGYSNTER